MTIYNCEKYIRLILGTDGSCVLSKEENASFGFPVAGESKAFVVEFTFPEEYKKFVDRYVYLSFYDKNYRIKLIQATENVYYFYMPSAIDKGGALGVTAEANSDSKNDTEASDDSVQIVSVKWKPFYITVLNAPVSFEVNLPDDGTNYLKKLGKDISNNANDIKILNDTTIKNENYDFLVESVSWDTDDLNGNALKKRYLNISGKKPGEKEVISKHLELDAVSTTKNGDMTPELLDMVHHSDDAIEKLGKLAIIDVETIMSDELGIDFVFSVKNLTDGQVEKIEKNIPMASLSSFGLMSKQDKEELGKAVKTDPVTGLIDGSLLPSYVDDVLEYTTFEDLPAGAGENGKIYVTLDTNKTYRWSGSSYVEISASLALGETSGTAYRGDRGKIAYDHSQVRGNPHNTSKGEVGLGNVANERQYSAQNMQPYPLGFASADNDFSWGVNIGSPLRVWNEASGGSIGFRKNCPANGKLSIVVDGKVYVDEGQKELATLDSPTFTGAPKVPTPSQSSNDNTVANTAWVKNILNEGSIALYRHRILLSGTNTSVSNAFTLGLIEVYTKSSQPITTVAGVAAALGITGNMELVPVSGCAENGSNHTVLCTEAWVSPSSITLHGMYFGYSSGNGIIERVSTTVTSVSDKVSLVQ